MQRGIVFFFACVCLFVVVQGAVKIESGLQLRNVNRHIDLSTQNARHTASVTVANNGNKAATQLYLTFSAETAKHISFLRVATEAGKDLSVGTADVGDKEGVTYYAVDLDRSLEPQETLTLTLSVTLSHVLTPHPAQISQGEKQSVKYSDNAFFLSPYPVASQKTFVKLSGMVVEYSQQPMPVNQKDNTVTYGPYLDTEPYHSSPISITYDNLQPFLTITKLTREIEISHWGNVAVTEDVDMRNDGAKLQGSFSRFDYQRNPAKSGAAVRSITHLLPPHAHEIYYRDEIGNISSSHVAQGNNKIHLELTPRYPLFGGWKTRFYMGYDLPIQFYVYNDASDSSKFMLNISFTPEFDLDVVIDDLVVRVILPEGARNIETHLPFSVDAQSTERHYTYLDTHGRPVVVLQKKNVVGEHNSLFQVTYSFTKLSMLQEPFLLVIAYLAFFIFAMAYVRFELSITKEKAVVAENDSRLTDLLLELKSIHAQRSELHNSLLQASKKLGKNKNLAAFSQEKKNIEAALGKCHTDVLKINNELEELDENIAAQVRQIERQEQSKAAYLEQMLTLDTSYRDKRIPKGAYEESKAQFEKFYNKVDEEIDRLVADLTDDLS